MVEVDAKLAVVSSGESFEDSEQPAMLVAPIVSAIAAHPLLRNVTADRLLRLVAASIAIDREIGMVGGACRRITP